MGGKHSGRVSSLSKSKQVRKPRDEEDEDEDEGIITSLH